MATFTCLACPVPDHTGATNSTPDVHSAMFDVLRVSRLATQVLLVEFVMTFRALTFALVVRLFSFYVKMRSKVPSKYFVAWHYWSLYGTKVILSYTMAYLLLR